MKPSGYDVIRAARQQAYDPATALLTAYPTLGSEWQNNGAHSLLVKPVNTPDLLRQLEALLITHQDHKVAHSHARLRPGEWSIPAARRPDVAPRVSQPSSNP